MELMNASLSINNYSHYKLTNRSGAQKVLQTPQVSPVKLNVVEFRFVNLYTIKANIIF